MTFLFSVDERREDPHTTETAEPSSARQRNADDSPILNAGFGSFLIFHGIRTSIGKETYNFVFVVFLRGWGIWIRACLRSSLSRVELTVFASTIKLVGKKYSVAVKYNNLVMLKRYA